MPPDLWHFAAAPFEPLCGSKAPGARTALIASEVTCPDCLRKRLGEAEEVIAAARQAVKGEGVISVAEWDALCEAVAKYDGDPAP